MRNVQGQLERLSDNRLVFVGRDTDKSGQMYLGFRNEHGDVKRLVLSHEAADALTRIITAPPGEPEPFPPDLEPEWRAVKPGHFAHYAPREQQL